MVKFGAGVTLGGNTSVDPVNATLLMSICSDIAAPAVGPYPGNMLTTPGGNPACQYKETEVSQ